MIRVKAAFFSITPPAPPDDDGSYLRWHLLDHMVEQYQLPGIQYALRYIAESREPFAVDALPDLSPSAGRVLVKTLIREGLLTRSGVGVRGKSIE